MTRPERGQASVELALVLPAVALLLLLLVQVALVARDQVLVTHAAREGARAAAVEHEPADARQAAERAASGTGTLASDRVEVRVERSRDGAANGTVAVRVRYRAPTAVPIVGRLLGDPVLEATVEMAIE